MMRDGFALIEKVGDFVSCENALQELVIRLDLPDEHGDVAKAPALAYIFDDLARRENGFSLGILAGHDSDGLRWTLTFRVLTRDASPRTCDREHGLTGRGQGGVRFRSIPMFFEVFELWTSREAV